VKQEKAREISRLVKNLDDFTNGFPRAKIAKVIKVLLEKINKISDTLDL
jgi:hypothetical protein